MCIFYHASNLQFNEGQVYSIENFQGDTTYDHKRRSNQEKIINIQLDKARPNGVISRIKCIYLFSNLEQCKEYARNAKLKHIYSVCPSDKIYGPYPMTIVTTLLNCQETIREVVINEYWNHTQKWKVYEYITSSIIVLEEISLENKILNMAGFDDYVTDRELSNRMFKCKKHVL